MGCPPPPKLHTPTPVTCHLRMLLRRMSPARKRIHENLKVCAVIIAQATSNDGYGDRLPRYR